MRNSAKVILLLDDLSVRSWNFLNLLTARAASCFSSFSPYMVVFRFHTAFIAAFMFFPFLYYSSVIKPLLINGLGFLGIFCSQLVMFIGGKLQLGLRIRRFTSSEEEQADHYIHLQAALF